MTKILLMAVLSLAPSLGFAVSAVPAAPSEVISSAPTGTRLIAFSTSGDTPHADAVAVFESAPDHDGVRHRTLMVFGRKNGQFVKDFSSDKLIACSACSQFHDDPFYPSHVKVTQGHVHIDQFDSGEKPSETTLDFARRDGAWHVVTATRRTVELGRYNDHTKSLLIPPSGLAADLDASWVVPVYLNAIFINKQSQKFRFAHGKSTEAELWQSVAPACTEQTCTILIKQHDGCISLVQDATSRSFGGAVTDSKGKAQAADNAMKACNAAGGNACKVVRTDCTQGIL